MALLFHLIWKRWFFYQRRSFYLIFSLFLTFILLTVVSSASLNYSREVTSLFVPYNGKIVVVQRGAFFAEGIPLNSLINQTLVMDFFNELSIIEGFVTVNIKPMGSNIDTDILIGVEEHGVLPTDLFTFFCSLSLAQGRFAQKNSNEVVVGKRTSAIFDDGKTVGDSINLEEKNVTIVGLLDTENLLKANYILMNHDLFTKIIPIMSSHINMLLLEPADSVSEEELESEIEKHFPFLEVLTENERNELSRELLNAVEQFTGMIAVISFIVGLLFIHSLTNMTLSERFREIGTLKSLGHSPYSILFEIVVETLIAAVIACIAGIFGTAIIMSSWDFITGSQIAGMNLVPLESYIFSFVIVSLISVIGTLLGTKCIIDMKPTDLLKMV